MKANPEYWRLYQDLGNVYYFDKKDYAEGVGGVCGREQELRRRAIWMKVMAAKIAAEGESPETSYFLWREVYETAKEPQIKKNAEMHLRLVEGGDGSARRSTGWRMSMSGEPGGERQR